MAAEPDVLLRVLARCVSLAVPLGFTLLSAAVIVDFAATRGQRASKRARCPVATTAMACFCACMYPLVRFRIGALERTGAAAAAVTVLVGLVLFFAGLGMNIGARLQLGAGWSSRIAVFDGQRLVSRGLYGLVRHPLYSSLIMMLLGVGIIYANAAVLALTTLVFMPMMAWRAGREEQVLQAELPGYDEYRRRVPMFVPFARRR